MNVEISQAHITAAARSADALITAAVRDAYTQVRPVRSVFPRLVRSPFVRDAKVYRGPWLVQVDGREIALSPWLEDGLRSYEMGFGLCPCSFEI